MLCYIIIVIIMLMLMPPPLKSVLYLLDLGSNDEEQTLPSDAKEELEPSSTSRVNLLYQLGLLLYLSEYKDSLLILESKILLLLT